MFGIVRQALGRLDWDGVSVMVERQQIRSELNAFGRPSRHLAIRYSQRYAPGGGVP